MNHMLQLKYFKIAALGTGLAMAGTILAGCNSLPGTPNPTPNTVGAAIHSGRELTQEQRNLDKINVDSLDQGINEVGTDANSI